MNDLALIIQCSSSLLEDQKQKEICASNFFFNFQETSTWLDDLPVDKEHSGVGFAYNQVYKEDAYKHQYHNFEDKCMRFR